MFGNRYYLNYVVGRLQNILWRKIVYPGDIVPTKPYLKGLHKVSQCLLIREML